MTICEKHKYKIWHNKHFFCPVCHEIEMLKAEVRAAKDAYAVQVKVNEYGAKALGMACCALAEERFDDMQQQEKAAKFYGEMYLNQARIEL